MQQVDLIESSFGSYVAPIVVVPKPNEPLKLCIDFWKVKKNNVNDVYPMHWIEKQLDAMTWITML